jgi:two-component system chemotaxis response regulator CheB
MNVEARSIRVLIVDDAVIVRSRLSKILATDPEIEVVGVAATGQIALAKLTQLHPDVVVLDLELPDMDGLQILSRIREQDAHLPVIMFSAMTTRGATATLDALTLGASDYVTKPSQLGNAEDITQYLRSNLIPKIKALSHKVPLPGVSYLPPTLNHPHPAAIAGRIKVPAATVDMVAIGVSTGGPNALATLLSELPPNFPAPIAIVQHMPAMFTRLLAERLTSKCALPVREAIPGATVCPGTIWLAPGDYHLRLERVKASVQLVVEQTPPQNSCRPSVDILFNSVAEIYGDRALAVILTGMGQDGLRGCQQIRRHNGQILAQDENSSVVWGMPGFVVNAGLADAVLPLERIMAEIVHRVNHTSARMGG